MKQIDKTEVENKVLECLIKLEGIYKRTLPVPSIQYNQLGKTAGYARYSTNTIELNSDFFIDNREKMINDTAPHELAHLISYHLYGEEGKGHKRCWKSVMINLGLTPKRCYDSKTVNLTNVKIKKHERKYGYRCSCERIYFVTKIKHNRFMRGLYGYFRCRICGKDFTYAGEKMEEMAQAA